ncbi:MAG: hypothetical protein ABIP51_10985 [Bacteroidia bacterium]
MILVSLIALFYHRKQKREKKEILPEQIKSVHELIDDINSFKIEVLIIGEEDDLLENGNRFKGLTLFEIGNCLDNKNDLSYEEYDEYDVYIEESVLLNNITKYLGYTSLPSEIKTEISSFMPGKQGERKQPIPRSVILLPVNKIKSNDVKSQKYIKQDAEAFDSWLTFKESSHSLHFVIYQWLKENPVSFEERSNSFNNLMNLI